MSRNMTGLLSLLVISTFTPLARSADGAVANLTMGTYISYMGGFEGEWSLELYLNRDGRAAYTVSSRDAGENPINAKRDILRGRWEVDGDSLTVKFSDENVENAIEYKISACLSYVSYTSVHCSLGLDPVENLTSHRFAHPLWHVVMPTGPRQK